MSAEETPYLTTGVISLSCLKDSRVHSGGPVLLPGWDFFTRASGSHRRGLICAVREAGGTVLSRSELHALAQRLCRSLGKVTKLAVAARKSVTGPWSVATRTNGDGGWEPQSSIW